MSLCEHVEKKLLMSFVSVR